MSTSQTHVVRPPWTSPPGWRRSSRTLTCARISSSPTSSTSRPYRRSKPTGKSTGVATERGTLPSAGRMSTLAPDQRAVLELVLRQGRSYGELSELLGIPERDVRARADAGLRALAGEPGAGIDSGRIADWLLGQQPDAEAERTRAAVARSPDAREWAAKAANRLGEPRGAVPSVPAAGDGDRPARPRPPRDESAGAAGPPPPPRR